MLLLYKSVVVNQFECYCCIELVACIVLSQGEKFQSVCDQSVSEGELIYWMLARAEDECVPYRLMV